MAERYGDWCQTFTGRRVWPLDPRPEDLDARDIAHALALQCRFGGHCLVPYSVAEHSVRVSRLVETRVAPLVTHHGIPPEVAHRITFAALLHDASEAYLVDIPRPVKRWPRLAPYCEAEHLMMLVVEQWAGLAVGDCSCEFVKDADEALLATEGRDLMLKIEERWHLRAEPLPERIEPWGWERAEREFLARFETLRGVDRG